MSNTAPPHCSRATSRCAAYSRAVHGCTAVWVGVRGVSVLDACDVRLARVTSASVSASVSDVREGCEGCEGS